VDFFTAEDGTLRFHDLAVDIGLEGARSYEVLIEAPAARAPRVRQVRLDGTELGLREIAGDATRLSLAISVAGLHAKPAYVDLTRKGARWTVTRVRHG
jgi:hypothetical protein